MSGVIDRKGVQWEHCNVCGDWVRLNDLHYGPITDEQAQSMNERGKEWAASGPNRGYVESHGGEMCDLCSTCVAHSARPTVRS